jgi:hypothetical protein
MINELFSNGQLFIPAWQVIFFIFLNSFCLLFGKFKLGLLISYCFVFYWGFIFNNAYFLDMFGNTTWGMFIYLFSGAFMLLMAVIGFFNQD